MIRLSEAPASRSLCTELCAHPLSPLAGLLLGAPAASQADPLTFTVVSKDVQQKLKDRDEAMKFSCKSMFDCDGDRREYAHNQYSKFEKRMASKGNALPRGDDSEEAAAAAAAAAEGPPK